MYKNRYKTPRYFNGTKQIEVPDVMGKEEMTTGVLNSGMATGQAAFQATGNPYIAAGVGLVGAVGGYSNLDSLKRQEQLAQNQAMRTNSQYQNLGIGNTQLDMNLDSYQAKYGYSSGSTKEIEIEKNEIVTDGDYNIKAIGETPHSQGGDKITVKEGDTVFPTQSPTDFKSILSKIKAYKNGMKEAKAALDAEKNSLPQDVNKANDGLNNPYQVTPYQSNVPQGYSEGDAGPLPDVYGDAIVNYNNKYGGQGTPEQYNSFLSENNISDRGMWNYLKEQGGNVGTAYSDRPIGSMSTAYTNSLYKSPTPSVPQYEPRSISPIPNVDESSFIPIGGQSRVASNSPVTPVPMSAPAAPTAPGVPEIPGNTGLINSEIARRFDPTKYANVAYNLVKSQEPVDTYKPQKPEYQKFQYEDLSAPARRAALDAQKINQSNIDKSGGSRGQTQSYLSQASAKYSKDVQDINTQEATRKMGVANQNIGLENRAIDMEYQDALRAREYEQKGKGIQQDFESEVAKELAYRGDLNEQQSYMRDRNTRQYESDKVYLNSMDGKYYKIDPTTGKTIVIN